MWTQPQKQTIKQIKILLLCIAMCLYNWAEKLSPSPRLAPLSCNLDHCNQCWIHQTQSNHQSDLPTGILIHPSVKPSAKTNNEEIVAMCSPFLIEQGNWAHLLAWLLWVATWTIVINAASTSHKATINQTWNPILPYYFFHSCRSLGFLIMHNSYALLSKGVHIDHVHVLRPDYYY
jgi:hypothetical protein